MQMCRGLRNECFSFKEQPRLNTLRISSRLLTPKIASKLNLSK
jgi:hypothetical protein